VRAVTPDNEDRSRSLGSPGTAPGVESGPLQLRCWHVHYRFCGVSSEITVYANDEKEARAKAVDQLRKRGLKVA
jgi:hypothetical protein